jgi:hypothetical protein
MSYQQQRPHQHHAIRRVLETPVQGDVFDEVRLALVQVFTDIQLRPFNNVLDRFRLNPGPLIVALKTRPFGSEAIGPAKEFWDALVGAVGTTNEQPRAEPWRRIPAFVTELSYHDREAAHALLVGLLKHGPQLGAPSEILTALEILRTLEGDQHQLKIATKDRGHSSKMKMWGFLVVGVSAVLAILIGFERLQQNPLSMGQLVGATAAAQPALEEIRPEVGKGQHFSLAEIRYCRFQEERIHLMKSAVRGPEDVAAFNAMVGDFNSRCSDFYFRDSDIATVTTELASHHQRLSAEALQIVATWPRHAVDGSEKPAP